MLLSTNKDVPQGVVKISELAVQEQRRSTLEKAALDIVTQIDKWTGGKKQEAGVKWIWELMQNAFYAATNSGKETLHITLRRKGSKFQFEHNAGPFTLKEANSVITSGTTKPYQSELDLGRYGKGLLVSHIISPRIQVTGRLVDEKYGIDKPFRLPIDRSVKDVEAILGNFKVCTAALDETIDYGLDRSITQFEYVAEGEYGQTALEEGLGQFDANCKYVLAFMSDKLKVEVERIDIPEEEGRAPEISKFEVVPSTSAKEGSYSYRRFDLDYSGSVRESISTLTAEDVRLSKSLEHAKIIIAFPFDPASNQINALEGTPKEGTRKAGIPKLFNKFPLAKTSTLNIPVIVQAPFLSDEDRLELSYPPEHLEELQPTLDQVAKLIEAAFGRAIKYQVKNAEELLSISPPRETTAYRQEWENALRGLVEKFKSTPAVRVGDPNRAQFKPPSDVDFPAAPDQQLEDQTFISSLASIGLRLRFNPPSSDAIAKWNQVRKGWQELGVRVGRDLTLESLTRRIESLKNTSELANFAKLSPEDTKSLLRDFYSLADLYRRAKGTPDYLRAAVYCNQRDLFKVPNALLIDHDVSSDLKRISGGLGFPLGEQLLLDTSSSLYDFFGSVGVGGADNTWAAKILYSHITVWWNTSKAVPTFSQSVMEYERWLLAQEDADPLLQRDLRPERLPWLCADGQLRTVEKDPFILPSMLMSENESRYAPLWPGDTRLSDKYTEAAAARALLKQRLLSFHVGTDELVKSGASLLSVEDLKALAVDYQPSEPIQTNVSQLAWGPRLLKQLQEQSSFSHSLEFVRFVLEYLVPADNSCTEPIEVKTRIPGIRSERTLWIYPCLWLSQVKRTSWLLDTGKSATEEPSKANLPDYLEKLDSSLVSAPQTQTFLKLHFDIRPLEITILALTKGNDRIEQHLTKMLTDIQSSGINPEEILVKLEKNVKSEIEVKNVDLRNKRFGRLVERMVAKAVENVHLDEFQIRIEPAWVGYDQTWYVEGKAILETDPGRENVVVTSLEGKEIAKFEVEVKATTTSDVRMTVTQAEESASKEDRYLLCVLDTNGSPIDLKEFAMRDFGDDEVSRLAELFRPRMRVSKIGQNFEALSKLLEGLAQLRPIELFSRPTFVVPSSVWRDNGTSLDDWAGSLGRSLKPSDGAG